MPTIAENLATWNSDNAWRDNGEEWSRAWGTSRDQWLATIFPRVSEFLPAASILEIAPGRGRWTCFLRSHCQTLVGVDLSPRSIEICRQRFSGDDRLQFHVNDGKSLDMVADGSIDFAFSFDSLVHCEQDVIIAYLHALRLKLRADAFGFIHHSNLGALLTGGQPRMNNPGWRGETVDAESFAQGCRASGMQCIRQEIVNWEGDTLFDCFSTVQNTRFSRPRRVLVNHELHAEAAAARLRNE